MKRLVILGLAALAPFSVAVASAGAFTDSLGGLSGFSKAQTTAQNNQRQAQVQLRVTVEKQVMQQDKQGNKQTVWQLLQGNVTVLPGDVLRYTVNGQNTSDRAVKNLVVTQPIPRQMVYVLDSATTSKNTTAEITYSIDNGKSFVKNPTIQVKLANGKVETQPAPASAYSSVRWKFVEPIGPGAIVNGNYQVRVR